MTARRAVLPAVLMVAALVATSGASPALAQSGALPGAEGEKLPDYVLEEDGTVIIEGDAATTCPSFAAFLEQGYFGSGDNSSGAQRVLEQCVEAGLLDPELAASGGTPASASTSPEVGGAYAKEDGLPDTGGLDLPALLAAAAFVVSARMLYRWARP